VIAQPSPTVSAGKLQPHAPLESERRLPEIQLTD
jgi:hypothetical protein